jgi:hypothetical protein
LHKSFVPFHFVAACAVLDQNEPNSDSYRKRLSHQVKAQILARNKILALSALFYKVTCGAAIAV